jgi:8-oxo-dGTP pyrophosphatase MutT (NUDIX family)
MRDMTACFLIRHTPAHQVLLGFKKRGFAAGKYAGIGGRVEADETIRAAARRELYEETGILASYSDLQAMGRSRFAFPIDRRGIRSSMSFWSPAGRARRARARRCAQHGCDLRRPVTDFDCQKSSEDILGWIDV